LSLREGLGKVKKRSRYFKVLKICIFVKIVCLSHKITFKHYGIFKQFSEQSNFIMHSNQSSQLSDALLISNYLNGSEYALEQLINRHQLQIFNFINSKINDRDTSEDLFQDTFIKVIRTLKSGAYNEEGKFLPWVMRIAHNLVIDHFRKSNRIPTLGNKEDFDIFQFISDNSPNAESILVQEQVLKDLQKLIQELPEDQKEVLVMRLYRDMSFKEIAENTNVSINTALGRMRYAIINLRKLINEHQIILEA
jgi:RNA polymerase sigma factor (sigma-70 family)